jgi:competence protein CoiA
MLLGPNMQLFALNQESQLIGARHADRRADYRCLECGGAMRRRAGPHRQPHFFHMRESASCFLSGKGMVHLQIQCHLWQLLPKGECELEKRFESIGRIADVAWLPKKLIFEVQCAPIHPTEVAARQRDYASLGFHLVWILHDTLYNQRRVSGAELYLDKELHYFSNIDAEGVGEIYDQFDIKKRQRRILRMGRLPVDLSQPKERAVTQLRPTWPLHFAGDLLDISDDSAYAKEAYLHLKRLQPTFYKRLLEILGRPYRLLFQMLLESTCK